MTPASRSPSISIVWAWACSLLVALLACERVDAPKPGKELRSIRLEAPLAEAPEHGLFGHGAITHEGLLERLLSMAKAKNVSGVLLQVGEMGGAWSRAADL